MDLAQDDNMLVTGHNSGTLMIWSVKKFEKIHEMRDLHHDVITSVCLSRDNHYIMTTSKYEIIFRMLTALFRDSVIKIIDFRTFGVVKEISDEQYNCTSTTNRACFSPDSRYILVGGNNKVLVFERETGEVR